MKIAFFGGTFDPVHIGHTGIAEHIVRSCAVDRLVFLPAACPPHKDETGVTAFPLRLEMLRIALSGFAAMEVSDFEAHRKGKSYTIDTLVGLSELYPGDSLYWIIGGDSLRQLHTWHRARELAENYSFIVYPRYGESIPSAAELSYHWSPDMVKKLTASVLHRVPEFDLSSTRIREMIAEENWIQAGACLPTGVIAFIKEHHLYSGESK